MSVILWRDQRKRTLEFQFSKSPCDMMTSKFAKFSLAINLIEVPRDVPCFVLLCSEERNWFTFLQNKMQDEMKFHVVPITEDDDILSPYGISKARRCLRTKLDSVFFAGPCTGGSPWNRINRWVSEATTQLIEAKKQLFWAMWEVFTSLLCELINLGSPALLELPRGCDDSENVRSHPIKLVTESACAIRELDAADRLPERSLLHWHFSRSTSSTSRCDWFLAFLWHLHSGFNENFVLRGQRPVYLLELFESLSDCHFARQIEPVKDTMTDGVDLKSVGQFSNKRITIAQTILKDSSAGTISALPPPPFRDARFGGHRLLSSEDDINQWIRFGMPPVIVYSAYFANSRVCNEATAEALELAYKILQRSQDSEKECSGWEFIAKGSR